MIRFAPPWPAWIALGLGFACLSGLVACGDDTSRVMERDAGDGSRGSGPADAEGDAQVPSGDGLCAACDGSCEEAVRITSAAHRPEPVSYPDPPPAGGPHAGCWGAYEVYSDPPLPASRWVHNLEHGAVVFLYHCPEGCAAEVAELEGLASGLERTILTPYDAMPPGFAAVAWGHRLVSSCLDVEALGAFYDAHFDQAPESVAGGPGGSC